MASPELDGTVYIPNGFEFGWFACGIKATGNDLGLLVCPSGCVAGGVYTTNLVRASCIDQNKSRTPSPDLRAVFVNSGNANACTGKTGAENSLAIADSVAQSIGCSPQQVVVLSTGVIGEQLPMEKIKTGIVGAAENLSSTGQCVAEVTQAFMTTDKFPKIVSREFDLNGSIYRILGIAKGAGMIGPNMATMLSVVMTDAPIAADDIQSMLATAVDQSFNRISVEGHTSTNDAVILMSSADEADCSGPDRDAIQTVLNESCAELAKMIPADGEGSAHLIEIRVAGARDDEAADQIARVVAASNLVKTAVSGCDPNWGRIVSAVGYAKVAIDPDEISLSINGICIYRDGTPLDFDEGAVSQSMTDRDVLIELSVGSAAGAAKHWTSDLTVDYVKLNADYRT